MTDLTNLKKITSFALSSLKGKEVILPSDYFNSFIQSSKNIIDFDNLNDIYMFLEKDFHEISKKLSHLIKETTFHTDRLIKAMEHNEIDIIEEVKIELKNLQKEIDELQSQLYCDQLTGLNNIRWLKEVFLKNETFVSEGALVFIDLNNFKQINDTFGHIIGDAVLRFFSNFFKQEQKRFITQYKHDFHIVRYAGDEFLLLIDKKDLKFITEEINKIQKILSSKYLVIKKDKDEKEKIKISFSFGVSLFKKGEDFESILSSSDSNMYINKKENK